MMKKWLCIVLALMLCGASASAEFDFSALKEMEDAIVTDIPGTADTIVRPMRMPYQGELGEDDLIANLDYIILPDQEVAALRICLSVSLFEPMQADQVAVTLDGKCYTFSVTPDVSEYDGIYMEDYALVMTSDSMPLMQALSKGKQEQTMTVVFICTEDGMQKTGSISLPAEDVKELLAEYAAFGGDDQDLALIAERFPCTVEKSR